MKTPPEELAKRSLSLLFLTAKYPRVFNLWRILSFGQTFSQSPQSTHKLLLIRG